MRIHTMIGVDLAKSVFQVHGASINGEMRFQRKLSRQTFRAFMALQPAAALIMEACGSADYWARVQSGLSTETDGAIDGFSDFLLLKSNGNCPLFGRMGVPLLGTIPPSYKALKNSRKSAILGHAHVPGFSSNVHSLAPQTGADRVTGFGMRI